MKAAAVPTTPTMTLTLVSAMLLRYALPLFAATDILAAIGILAGLGWLLRKRWLLATTRIIVAGAALTACISGAFFAQHSAAPFRIVQPEHLTFENRDLVSHLRATQPWQAIYAADALAAQIFRVPRS